MEKVRSPRNFWRTYLCEVEFSGAFKARVISSRAASTDRRKKTISGFTRRTRSQGTRVGKQAVGTTTLKDARRADKRRAKKESKGRTIPKT